MITREDMAQFIVRVAAGDYTTEEWLQVAVNHYSDERIEDARRKLVRYVAGYPPPSHQSHLSLKQLLYSVAADLRADKSGPY